MQGSAIAAAQHAKSACKPDARGGPVSAPQEQAPCEQVASAAAEDPAGEPASSPSHSTQPLLPSGEQDRPASIRTHAEGVAEVDCMPSVLTPTPTSEDATTPPRPCMAEEGAGSAAPSWAGSPRLPSPPNPDRMERPRSPAPAAGAGALRRLVVASKPPRRTGAGRSAPPLPPAARAGERSRKTRPPAARPPRPPKSTLAHRDLVRGADSAAGSRRSAPVASKGCRLPPRSPAAAHSAEAAGASGDLQVVTAASRGPAPAGAAAWPLLEAAANRRERRVVVERLFRNPTACTQWHLAAVVRCLPDSVQRAFMAWTEVSGQVRSQRGRCAKAVVRETKRLLCTLCSSPAHHSTPSTAALDAALKDAIQVARSRDAALRREPRVCCGDAAETYVLMLSSFKSAQARWGARCGHAVTEIDASWMGEDSSSLTLVAGRLSSAISASLPAAAAAQPPDMGPLRPLNDSQVLLVERLAEDRLGVACMPLMRVAVGSLARASHGGGLADVLAERVQRYLHNCGGDAPALLQVPGTVTVEFEWRSRTNTGLLLPVVEFLPHFFSKGCRFDLQDVAAVEGDACLPYRARLALLHAPLQHACAEPAGQIGWSGPDSPCQCLAPYAPRHSMWQSAIFSFMCQVALEPSVTTARSRAVYMDEYRVVGGQPLCMHEHMECVASHEAAVVPPRPKQPKRTIRESAVVSFFLAGVCPCRAPTLIGSVLVQEDGAVAWGTVRDGGRRGGRVCCRRGGGAGPCAVVGGGPAVLPRRRLAPETRRVRACGVAGSHMHVVGAARLEGVGACGSGRLG